ncbi:hypothetical protein BDV12DRAFT_201722 [Aspergillus spectabilis]
MRSSSILAALLSGIATTATAHATACPADSVAFPNEQVRHTALRATDLLLALEDVGISTPLAKSIPMPLLSPPPLDEQQAAGAFRGPMHAIPFLVKVNYYTDDKHNTSERTLVLLGGKYSS